MNRQLEFFIFIHNLELLSVKVVLDHVGYGVPSALTC